ncbi:hypothetical protein DTO166G5_3356 [Paecilomyces variotii]|nr:hypothetical protein DTO166G5_3356 [Paecilomyces variotii]
MIKTHLPPVPSPTTTSSVAPIPTVIPGNEPIFQHVHGIGKRTLWVVTVAMGISSLVFYILATRAPISKRLFHILTSLITTISFISYLAMATGDGITWSHIQIHESHKHVPDTKQDVFRQIFWFRYVNWILTSPLILINLALLGGMSGAHLLVAVSADLIMFGTGILASFAGHDGRKWAWFTISAIAYLVVVHQIGFNGGRAAANKDVQTKRFYSSIAGTSLVTLALYPIILAASTLSHRISLDAEVVIWSVFDIVAQGIFGYWLLLTHDRSSSSFSLYLDGFWSRGIGQEGAIRVGEEDGA